MNKINKTVKDEIKTIKYLSKTSFDEVVSIRVKTGDKFQTIAVAEGKELATICTEWAKSKYEEMLKKEQQVALESYLKISIPTVESEEDKNKIIEHLKNQLTQLENEKLGNN